MIFAQWKLNLGDKFPQSCDDSCVCVCGVCVCCVCVCLCVCVCWIAFWYCENHFQASTANHGCRGSLSSQMLFSCGENRFQASKRKQRLQSSDSLAKHDFRYAKISFKHQMLPIANGSINFIPHCWDIRILIVDDEKHYPQSKKQHKHCSHQRIVVLATAYFDAANARQNVS